MAAKEARARIKINRLLEDAGWRFFASDAGPANIALEPNVKLTQNAVDELGENFEQTRNGFIDFLLLDENRKPLLVLEAKSEDKNPLVGKEQARKYAKSQNCRFIILSNGNLHYFWDLEQGNPHIRRAGGQALVDETGAQHARVAHRVGPCLCPQCQCRQHHQCQQPPRGVSPFPFARHHAYG